MRILLLTQILPYPTRSGAEQRTHLLYRALTELADVDMLLVTEKGGYRPNPDVRAHLEREYGLIGCLDFPSIEDQWPWKIFGALGGAWPARIAKLVEGPAAEYAEQRSVNVQLNRQLEQQNYSLIVSRYLLPFAAARPGRAVPAIVDVDDFPSEVVARKASQTFGKGMQSLYWRWLTLRARGMEARLLAGCRHVWVAKQSDLSLTAECEASVLPNIPYFSEDSERAGVTYPPKNQGQIVFVGTLGWKPNELAIDNFLDRCWGQIRTILPHAVLRIVGYGMSEAMRTRWEKFDGVEPVGFVDDVSVEYAAAELAICPIEEGGGSNIKVLEALQHERTVVCTEWGARGYERTLVDPGAILVADNMQSFAEACIQLLREPQRLTDMAALGKQIVDSQYSYAAFRASVHHAIRMTTESQASKTR